MKLKRKTEGSYTYINLRGNKVNKEEKNEKKGNIFNKREYGEFNINIKIDKIALDQKKPEIQKAEENKGVATIIYKLLKEEEEDIDI